MQYRNLTIDEINLSLFSKFERRQVVTDCWRRENGSWVVKSDPFIDNWSDSDYRQIITELKNTLESGGFVYGAFADGFLKGFVSAELSPIGSRSQYIDLACIYVSQELRGQGIGKRLFSAAAEFARQKGAEKLYISAHSAVESQAFYKSVGCVEAAEYSAEHVAKEPFDCQLECAL